MEWFRSFRLPALLLLAQCLPLCAADASVAPATATLTLQPVEVASAYSQECPAKVLPSYPHPEQTVFVGGFTTSNSGFLGTSRIGVGTLICQAYQGLLRFNLGDVNEDSIASATLFFESVENYDLDGTTSRIRATCVGGIGATTQPWSASQIPLTPLLTEVAHFQPPRGSNFISPPIDITAFLKEHMAAIRTNGLLLDGTVENVAIHYCYAALGRVELRLILAPASH